MGTGWRVQIVVNLYFPCPSPTCPSSVTFFLAALQSAELNSFVAVISPFDFLWAWLSVWLRTLQWPLLGFSFDSEQSWLERWGCAFKACLLVADALGGNDCPDEKYLEAEPEKQVRSTWDRTLQEKMVSVLAPCILDSRHLFFCLFLFLWQVRFVFILGCDHLSRKVYRKWQIRDRSRNVTSKMSITFKKRQHRKIDSSLALPKPIVLNFFIYYSFLILCRRIFCLVFFI